MKNFIDHKLTSTVTVGQLQTWLTTKNETSKKQIINFINHRLTERYLKHLDKKNIKSGFLKMAIACLLIETFQSFKQGKKDNKQKSRKAFLNFFKTENDKFPVSENIANEFFDYIRCGILHQAETRNGWRILLEGKIINKDEKTINADLFLNALGGSINRYVTRLENSDWSELIWINAIKKLNYICDNCKPLNLTVKRQ